MKRRYFLVLFNAGVALYTISGTVYDADGTTAVASATVALGALSATSGADGTYTITDVPAGTSGSMTCTKAGYSWAAITVAAMAANLTSQNYTNAWWAAGGCAASCVAAWNGKVATEAASLVNLANPGTYNLTKINTPTHTANQGWTGVAASGSCYNTGITPTANTWTYIARVSGVSAQGIALGYSASGGAHHTWVYPNNGAGGRRYENYSATGGVTNATACQTGVMLMAGPNCYLNGVGDGTITQDGAGTRLALYLAARNNNGTAATFVGTGIVVAAAIYSATLTPTQAAAISTAMAAL